MKTAEPMSDHAFRLELTKAMGIGQHYALPQEKLLCAVRTRQASHVKLHRLAGVLGLEVPDAKE